MPCGSDYHPNNIENRKGEMKGHDVYSVMRSNATLLICDTHIDKSIHDPISMKIQMSDSNDVINTNI